MLALAAGAAIATGFEIRWAKAYLVGESYRLDADINFDFSDKTLEALANGVPLRVIFEVEILRNRRFLWDKKVARRRAELELKLHMLSNQYLITDLARGTVHSYLNLQSARAALGTIRGFALIRRDMLAAKGRYHIRARARLDIEALPSPLRPLAYLSSVWRLDSEWSRWPLQR